jgi:drug/metabolite transporter (DMT)-like permease
MTRQLKAYAYALAAVLLRSTVATAFKLSLRYLDVLQLLFISSVTATLVLLTITIVRRKLSLLVCGDARSYGHALVLGLLNPLCYYAVLFKAFDLLPAQIAQALNYSWAITLMLLSVPLLGHRITRFDLTGALIGYAGVVLICIGGSRSPNVDFSIGGVALALVSTIIWSLYWIAKTRDTMDPVVSLTSSFVLATPVIGGVCLLYSGLAGLESIGIAGAVYIGLFEMGITYVLWLLALQHAKRTATVSTMIFLSPFVSLIFIHQILGEPILGTTIGGLVMIVAGLTVQRCDGDDTAIASEDRST